MTQNLSLVRLHLHWGIVLYYVGVPDGRGLELDEI